MISANSMLGVPAVIYQFGSQFGMIAFAFPLVMYSVTNWFLPVFWKLGVSTSYEVKSFNCDEIANTAFFIISKISPFYYSTLNGDSTKMFVFYVLFYFLYKQYCTWQ